MSTVQQYTSSARKEYAVYCSNLKFCTNFEHWL